jgi:hypothetical protein
MNLFFRLPTFRETASGRPCNIRGEKEPIGSRLFHPVMLYNDIQGLIIFRTFFAVIPAKAGIHGSILLGGFAGANRLTMTTVITLSLSKGGCPTKDLGHDG